jgi:hypothetical protein
MPHVKKNLSHKSLLIPGHDTYTAEDWASVLVRMLLLASWGIPKEFISDRDFKFVSAVWKKIFTLLGTKHLDTTRFQLPAADSTISRVPRPRSHQPPIHCQVSFLPSTALVPSPNDEMSSPRRYKHPRFQHQLGPQEISSIIATSAVRIKPPTLLSRS